MNPFYFGSSQQQLFGIYEPARGRGARAVVVCHPWAREYLLAYPTLRLLASRLSDAGFHVLRFDYFGTGDSAGDAGDGNQAQWLADVGTAIDEIRDVSGATRVSLIGMRYGAVLAARTASARAGVVDRLVLWDPLASGQSYLEELGVPSGAAGDVELDVQGAVLTPQLRRDFEAVTPDTYALALPRTLVLHTSAASHHVTELVTRARGAGTDVGIEHVPDVQVWREEWGRGGKGLAVNAVSRVVSWLD